MDGRAHSGCGICASRSRPVGAQNGDERTSPPPRRRRARPDFRPLRHHKRQAGCCVRSRQRHVREPLVVVVALAWPRGAWPCWTAGSLNGWRRGVQRQSQRSRATTRGPSFVRRRRAGDMTIGIDDVSAHARDGDWRLLDARAPERYRGEVEPMDPVCRTHSGRRELFFQRNIDERGRRCARRKICAPDLPSTSMASRRAHVVCYCGSGVQACHNPARARARGYIRSEAVSGIVESVGERSFEAGRARSG